VDLWDLRLAVLADSRPCAHNGANSMAIPDFQTLMLPVLKQFAAAGSERRSSEIRAPLAAEFALTPDEIAQRFAEGVQTVFGNRIAWAISHLRRASILESPHRGIYVVTQRGRDVLKESPTKIDSRYLNRFTDVVSPTLPMSWRH
jgi:restriction system protein